MCCCATRNRYPSFAAIVRVNFCRLQNVAWVLGSEFSGFGGAMDIVLDIAELIGECSPGCGLCQHPLEQDLAGSQEPG